MPPVHVIVLQSRSLGRVAFSFDATGRLLVVKLRSRRRPSVGTPAQAPKAPKVTELRTWLADFEAGEAGPFPGSWQLPGQTPFQQAVYRTVAAIPAGEALSYGEVADAAGSPGAARAVGNAMARNPIPLVVPCHRVLASGGALGGFTGGLDLKKSLLPAEGAGVGV